MEYGVAEMAADMPPEPCTATVESGHVIVDPTLSAPHLAGHAAWRYCVMPLVVDEPCVRW